MKGFKDFIMRGNLIELAVAFVIGAAFATVVKSFTDVFMGLIGKIGGQPDVNGWKPGGIPLGAFITAAIAFVIVAAVVYFFVVTPYEAYRARKAGPAEEPAPEESVVLLTEIRDALRARG
jgi:large conductance mechanosensitive channel